MERKMKEGATTVGGMWGAGEGGEEPGSAARKGDGQKAGAGGKTEPNGAICHADDEVFRQIKSRM